MAKTKKNVPVLIGVIGGSGVYEIEGIENIEKHKISTPFGSPSDVVTVGSISGIRCAFLPRHARGHRILPSEVNSRANIYALKSLGVQQILSISACGSLKENVKPKDFVIPDQIFDRTKARPGTFFGEGIVAHVGSAEPFCNEMRDIIHRGVMELGIKHHFGGTYVCIEGPRFSTKAESNVNRSHGFSVVGMTAAPEAFLAREAEICYATVGLVTDYDVWKEGEEVTGSEVLENMRYNVTYSKRLIKLIVPRLAERLISCSCPDALKNAIFTDPASMNMKTAKKLDLIIRKYLKK